MKTLRTWDIPLQAQCGGDSVSIARWWCPSAVCRSYRGLSSESQVRHIGYVDLFVVKVNFVAAKPGCAAALGLHSSRQMGVVSGCFSRVFQVEPEVRLPRALSQRSSSVRTVFERTCGAWSRETAEICPLSTFPLLICIFPLPSSSCHP